MSAMKMRYRKHAIRQPMRRARTPVSSVELAWLMLSLSRNRLDDHDLGDDDGELPGLLGTLRPRLSRERTGAVSFYRPR